MGNLCEGCEWWKPTHSTSLGEGSTFGGPYPLTANRVEGPHVTEGVVGPSAGGVSVRCWGVRGSVPTPGADTVEFGGNTSCVELLAGGERLILDAGTGIRLLGEKMALEEELLEARVFLTHFHWDHIQGFPFFAPLHNPRFRLQIFGPQQHDVEIRTLFARQLGPVYFPVPFRYVGAETSFIHFNEGTRQEGPFRIQALRMRHPSFTVGYRIEVEGQVVCYIPDHEIQGSEYAVDEDPSWREAYATFVRGADLLLHDAMYTEEEYPRRIGWGHSTYEQVIRCAIDEGVRRVLLFHHAPDRSDRELTELVERYRERYVTEAIQIDAASEGQVLLLGCEPSE